MFRPNITDCTSTSKRASFLFTVAAQSRGVRVRACLLYTGDI